MLYNSLRQPHKRLLFALCVHSAPFRCCPRHSSERPRCPAIMTKPAKLCTLIVLISGESPSQNFYIILQRVWCLLTTSISLCEHHMAEHALDLDMHVCSYDPDLGNIVMS